MNTNDVGAFFFLPKLSLLESSNSWVFSRYSQLGFKICHLTTCWMLKEVFTWKFLILIGLGQFETLLRVRALVTEKGYLLKRCWYYFTKLSSRMLGPSVRRTTQVASFTLKCILNKFLNIITKTNLTLLKSILAHTWTNTCSMIVVVITYDCQILLYNNCVWKDN